MNTTLSFHLRVGWAPRMTNSLTPCDIPASLMVACRRLDFLGSALPRYSWTGFTRETLVMSSSEQKAACVDQKWHISHTGNSEVSHGDSCGVKKDHRTIVRRILSVPSYGRVTILCTNTAVTRLTPQLYPHLRGRESSRRGRRQSASSRSINLQELRRRWLSSISSSEKKQQKHTEGGYKRAISAAMRRGEWQLQTFHMNREWWGSVHDLLIWGLAESKWLGSDSLAQNDRGWVAETKWSRGQRKTNAEEVHRS